ncbi:MAG TPA: tetratricopeptide repeat protein [Candidatus Acidoferrum sp.]|nr:tetratricopeptide repeat protein [Candidatus Acidoferrum sp.]
MQGDFRIGKWLIQPQMNMLQANGATKHVEPKAMQVLVYLSEHTDEVITKERLIGAVWADTFVTDDVLTRCISELRKAFEDDAKNPQVIETIPRSGYRLVAAVQRVEAQPAAARALKRRWPVALAAVAGLLVVGIALNVGNLRRRMFRPALTAPIRSLAVLPLANLSGDPEQEYFADGMTEELITDLAKIGALRVISRTSVMGYKAAHKPLPEIARELNVDAIIEGTVQRSGGRVRIAAQLIEARTDQHLWAESYERDLRDVLALQGEVASAIAGEIRVKLTPQENARMAGARPLNPEAHEAYLQGLYYWNKLTEEDIKKSIERYQRAIQLAPEYAPAYSALAFSYTLLASMEFAPSRENYTQAKKLAQKAIELDDSLSDAHAALGFVLCYGDWDWAAAEAQFKRANALEPNGELGHHVYAVYLGDMGRSEEAISEMKRSIESDPLSVLALVNLGWLYWQAGQPEKAIEQYRKILEMDPKSWDAHAYLGWVYELQGNHTQAIVEWREARRLSENSPWTVAGLGHAYAAAGKSREAHEILNELKQLSKRRYVSPYQVASVYAGLGEREQALLWLGKALEEHNDSLVSLKEDPDFARLRTDPRFQEILRRIGLLH